MDTATAFNPSAVNLLGCFPPLVDTMGKTEAEVAATYIVRTLAASGDTWRPVTWKECRERIKADCIAVEKAGGPNKAPAVERMIFDLLRNPFTRPDVDELVRRGFARWISEPGMPVRAAIELTDEGRERLRRWVVIRDH
jgi:hypothetical protein